MPEPEVLMPEPGTLIEPLVAKCQAAFQLMAELEDDDDADPDEPQA